MEEEKVCETQECIETDSERAERLEGELAALRASIEEERAHNSRMLSEYSEFSELFPDVAIENVGESVWESVKHGIPLAAAYALYDRKRSVAASAAHAVNEKNSVASTGALGTGAGEEYFSAAEVRSMSKSEVSANYDKIMASMKKWK